MNEPVSFPVFVVMRNGHIMPPGIHLHRANAEATAAREEGEVVPLVASPPAAQPSPDVIKERMQAIRKTARFAREHNCHEIAACYEYCVSVFAKVISDTDADFAAMLESDKWRQTVPIQVAAAQEQKADDLGLFTYDLDAVIARPASPIPASGWVMVPKQATTEMKIKGGVAYEKFNRNVVIGEIWDAMLAAAPVAPGETK